MSWDSILVFILLIYIVMGGFWSLMGRPPNNGTVAAHIMTFAIFGVLSFVFVAAIYMNFANVLQSGEMVSVQDCSSEECVLGWTDLAGTGLLIVLMYWQCYIAGTTMHSVYHNS